MCILAAGRSTECGVLDPCAPKSAPPAPRSPSRRTRPARRDTWRIEAERNDDPPARFRKRRPGSVEAPQARQRGRTRSGRQVQSARKIPPPRPRPLTIRKFNDSFRPEADHITSVGKNSTPMTVSPRGPGRTPVAPPGAAGRAAEVEGRVQQVNAVRRGSDEHLHISNHVEITCLAVGRTDRTALRGSAANQATSAAGAATHEQVLFVAEKRVEPHVVRRTEQKECCHDQDTDGDGGNRIRRMQRASSAGNPRPRPDQQDTQAPRTTPLTATVCTITHSDEAARQRELLRPLAPSSPVSRGAESLRWKNRRHG